MKFFAKILIILTSSAIDKIFEIYTFFEKRTEIRTFFENRAEICIFSKIGLKYIVTFFRKYDQKFRTFCQWQMKSRGR